MYKWDTEQYSLFLEERVTPNLDLINKLPDHIKTIVDLGCGSGDCSTASLRECYPGSQLLAIDISEEIINQARKKSMIPDVEWRISSIENFNTREFDLIYIGSTFQWINEHEK